MKRNKWRWALLWPCVYNRMQKSNDWRKLMLTNRVLFANYKSK